MEKTQEEALKRALVLLKAAGVEYAIRTNDGTVFGDLLIAKAEPVKERRTRVRSNVPKELWDQFRAIVNQMEPGDCKRFPIGEYPRNTIRSGITGMAHARWGKGAHISSLHVDTNEIELLRVE